MIVSFIGYYLGAIFETPAGFMPVWWIVGYAIFLGLNLLGVELSFKVSLVVTLLALAVLVIFWVSASLSASTARLQHRRRARQGAGRTAGRRRTVHCRSAGTACWRPCPSTVWLFLAIERLPLAAEESHDPKRDMPKACCSGSDLAVSATLITTLNAGIGVTNGTSGARSISGRRSTRCSTGFQGDLRRSRRERAGGDCTWSA